MAEIRHRKEGAWGYGRQEMENLLYEAFLIALLILLNGYLAGTEIAVVTARKSYIKQG